MLWHFDFIWWYHIVVCMSIRFKQTRIDACVRQLEVWLRALVAGNSDAVNINDNVEGEKFNLFISASASGLDMLVYFLVEYRNVFQPSLDLNIALKEKRNRDGKTGLMFASHYANLRTV